ncbi:MAG: VOC family protein [Pseudohongiellaceae bacterium]
MMISVKGIDHVVFRTTRLDDMLHFYSTVLGCKLERSLPPDTGLYQLRAGGSLIDLVTVDSELGKAGGGPPRQEGRNVEHVCLLLTNVAEGDLIDYLDSVGIVCEPFTARYGATGFGRSTYIRDPEGNIVELKLEAS